MVIPAHAGIQGRSGGAHLTNQMNQENHSSDTPSVIPSAPCHPDRPLCHSDLPFCHPDRPLCHSDLPFCHSERSEAQ